MVRRRLIGSRCYTARMATVPVLEPDAVIELLKRDVDRTLLRANLRLSMQERLQQLQKALDDLAAMRAAFGASQSRQ